MFDKMVRGIIRTGKEHRRPKHRPAARATAATLSVCMAFTLMPPMAFAVEEETGLCEHHPAHTAECGYQEAEPGRPCGHEHTQACYTDELICGLVEDEDVPDEDDLLSSVSNATEMHGHKHTREFYALDCPHERGEHEGNGGLGSDADCGYIEAVKGHPCGYVCEVCKTKDSGTKKPAIGNGLPAPEETKPEPVEGTDEVTRITGFDELDAEVQNRLIPAGTEWNALGLPTALEASGYLVSDHTERIPEALTVEGIIWEIDPDNAFNEGNSIYSPEIGSYCLTPVLPKGYELESGVELPEIYVMIDGQTEPLDYDRSIYSEGDVNVINAIIASNGLSATPNDPEGWGESGIVTWSTDSPKRIHTLSIGRKNLTGTLDVSGLSNLQELSCYRNRLTELKVSGLTSLDKLYCYSNQLTELDVSDLANLTYLSCRSNKLDKLDVSDLTSLTNLYCYSNQLTELKVSGLPLLTEMYCDGNQLTELNVSGLPLLTELSCYDNQLAKLDVSDLSGLTELDCHGNKLTELNVSGLTNLGNLYCYSNQLTELNVSGSTSLFNLACYDNRLTELDVSGLPLLTELYCYSNQLTKLDVSGLTLLDILACSDNQLTELNMSGLTSLVSLFCEGNQLTELNVSGLTLLDILFCFDNRLTKLDVSGLTSLDILLCHSNPLASLKLEEGKELTVESAAGGTVELTGYNPLYKSVVLTATEAAGSGYTFRKWLVNGTTIADAAANPVIFTLDGEITLTPVFADTSTSTETGGGSGGDGGGSSSTSSGGSRTAGPSTTTVTAENVTTSTNQGKTTVTIKPDASAINSAAQAAGATAENPLQVQVEVPRETINGELQKPEVISVAVEVVIPKAAADNPNVNMGVTIPRESVQTTKELAKELSVTVKNENHTLEAVWTLNGQSMKNAAGEATDLYLSVHTAPVQSNDPTAAAVKQPVIDKGYENGLVLTITANGNLLSSVRLTVPSTNGTGITAGETVTLYRFDQATGAVSGGIYPVDANGNVTIDVPAGIRIGAKESYVLLKGPVQGNAAASAEAGTAYTIQR